MKILKINAVTGLIVIVLLSIISCKQPITNKDAADEALAILESLRGAVSYIPHEDGNFEGAKILSVDSFYIDDTTHGVRSVGWIYWDNNETPPDTSDDIFTFVGQKIYLDWNFTENWYLKMIVGESDRETEMAVKKVNIEESLYVHLGKVNRPGGIQYGPGSYSSTIDTIDLIIGIHHAETPYEYGDNYSWLEFYLYDVANSSADQFWVRADFRPDNSGSGEIRNEDIGGEIVATFEWDEFGRGTLTVDGSTYPFKW